VNATEPIVERLHAAAKRRAAAEAERHAATAELRQRVQDARNAGIGPTQIARETGLSRQAVYELLGERPSQRS